MKMDIDKSLSIDELTTHLIRYKKELMLLRFQKSIGELKNTSQVKRARRSVARIYTILNKK